MRLKKCPKGSHYRIRTATVPPEFREVADCSKNLTLLDIGKFETDPHAIAKGFEPFQKTATNKALGFVRYKSLGAGPPGLEPGTVVLETTVLPLNYGPKVRKNE